MEKQPTPSDSNCPYCGGEPQPNPTHRLNAIGYTDDEVEFTCSECEGGWVCGVPIGESEPALAEKLFCDSCESRYGLPHGIIVTQAEGVVLLEMKCPNSDCKYYWRVRRELDEDGRMMYGYPQITGSLEDAERAEGYTEADL